MAGRVWTSDETLLAFRLYCLTPFGKIHTGNKQIKELASLLDRSPSSVAMKMLNLASFDPEIVRTGRVSLKNASRLDSETWDKFHAHMSDLYWAGEEARKRLGIAALPGSTMPTMRQFVGLTEVTREVPVRRAQSFFRNTVLASYGNRCAVSGIEKVELLTASHIIPWKTDPERRTDPSNGISLSALHDRAFDRGLIAFGDNAGLLVSPKLKNGNANDIIRVGILEFEGKRIEGVEKFSPDPQALAYHRERIFKAS